MERYQISQLEAAGEFLNLLGIPGPYTFKEKVRTIEVSKAAIEGRLRGSLENCYVSIKEVANKICKDIYAERVKRQKRVPREIPFVDWRDDLELSSSIASPSSCIGRRFSSKGGGSKSIGTSFYFL
jgi:hypothetical protein